MTSDPNAEDLRAEYSVIGSYVTKMTGLRFQTMTIYIAALGFIVSQGTPEWPTVLLILAVSLGLWILELRNRDLLHKLGERGRVIEGDYWKYPRASKTDDPGAGFFLDEDVPATLRIGTFVMTPKSERLGQLISHEFGIDLIFLAVIAYAILLLALPGY